MRTIAMKKSVNMVIGLFVALIVYGTAVAQTCDKTLPQTTPTSRFVSQGNDLVIDTKTNLMWKRCSEGTNYDTITAECSGNILQTDWIGALSRAESVNAGTVKGGFGYQDWRVPNFKELASISELACVSPAINLRVFPTTPATAWYWTSTPSPTPSRSPTYAAMISAESGAVLANTVNSPRHVRLVRDMNKSINTTVADFIITPDCWWTSSCSLKDFPVYWGVVDTFYFDLPLKSRIVDVIITASWGDLDNFDTSAVGEIYLEGELVAECLGGAACQQGGGLANWSYSFAASSADVNWRDKFADGVAQLSVIQNNTISVILSNIQLQIIYQ